MDAEGGCGVQGAPIYMDRHVDVCRQHTIVVDRQAWHPDVVKILHGQLQVLPKGWMLAIDATEFPEGQAHIVVEADGTVHGWSDYAARHTLNAFGFDHLKGPLQHLYFAVGSMIGHLGLMVTRLRVRRMKINIADRILKD